MNKQYMELMKEAIDSIIKQLRKWFAILRLDRDFKDHVSPPPNNPGK